MSDSRTNPPADDGARSTDSVDAGPRPDAGPGATPDDKPGDATTSGAATAPAKKPQDPLRGSATSGIWLAVVVFALLLVLLAIFILQNTGSVDISFLGWTGSAPLAALILIAAAAGALLVVMAGSMRIIQLRRRVRRDRKSSAPKR